MSDHDLASQIKEDVRKSRRASFLWTLAGVAAGLASILWVVTQSYGISRSAEVLARGDALRALAPIAQTLGVTAPPEDYAKYVSDMQEAGRKLAAASQEVPALRLQNTALEAEQQETADELNAAQGELTRVSAEIPILKQREVALQTEKKVAEASAEKLAEEKRSIAEELATKDVIAEQFRKQSEEGETQIAALALKVAGAEADLIATTSKLRTSETSRAALESEIAKSSGRISELSGSLKAKDTEIAMLSLRIKTLKGSGRDGQ